MGLVVALVVGLLGVVAPVAPAGAVPLPIDLDLVSGELRMRDSEEPAALARPTTLDATVDDETGAISSGTFAAAPLNFSFDITSPVDATVHVEARFTQITPGVVTGAVTKLSEKTAAVSVGVDVRVDLRIRVSQLVADCAATPVSLRLTSTAPYDLDTDRVTLRDANFRVPPVPVTSSCIDIIADGVNARLAGGGHSLTMVMQGEIPPIRIGIYETSTALTVAPSRAREGDEVTLSAKVTPKPGPDLPSDALGGLVQFRDGDTVLGDVPVGADGVATFTTSDLPAGRRALAAAYQGDEVYAPSTSPASSYLVAAAPTVSLPARVPAVVIGGNARPFTATLANPADIGGPIDDGRLDVTIARPEVLTPTQAALTPDRVVLEHFDGAAWVPVATTEIRPRVLQGSVAGVDLAVGAQREARFRVRALAVGTTAHATNCNAENPTCPGPLTVTTALVAADGGRTFATDDAPMDMVEVPRRATTVAFGGGNPQPHTVRQGFSILIPMQLSPNFGSVPWPGAAEVYIDGIQVQVHNPNLPFADNPSDQFAVTTASSRIWVLLPDDIDPGSHQVTVRYLGDPFHGPGEVTSTFTVLERLPQAHALVCRDVALIGQTFEFGANLVFDVDGLPATAVAGTEIPFTVADARLLLNRSVGVGPVASLITEVFEAATFDLAGQGTASAAGMTKTGGTGLPPSPKPAPESAVDQTLAFEGVTGTVTVAGDPGEVVPVELTDLVITRLENNLLVDLTCTARGGAMRLGEVEVAGTTVTASPAVAREGTDTVEIEAETFPAGAAGTVTFSSDLDGTLGSDTVSGGAASWSAGNLRPGTHVITASFDATDPSVPDSVGTTSVRVSYSPRTATERFVVAARTDYLGSADRAQVVADAAKLDGGKTRTAYLNELSRSDAYLAHVVNGMYRDTLGRAGDETGVAFWIGRLKAGWSVARVAASFYSSDEYHRRVGGTDEAWVRDLYQVLLGRTADESGLAYWVAEIPKRGRDQVAHRFFQTPESARARVTALYDQFLARRPNAADRDFWATRVVARGDLILAVELTLSAEYSTRAGQRFPLV